MERFAECGIGQLFVAENEQLERHDQVLGFQDPLAAPGSAKSSGIEENRRSFHMLYAYSICRCVRLPGFPLPLPDRAPENHSSAVVERAIGRWRYVQGSNVSLISGAGRLTALP